MNLLDETDFLVVDVETTGLYADSGDRVCEIGAVKLRGGAVVDTLGSLIDPRRPISSGAYSVNGISPQMLADAPVFGGVAERLWSMMEDTTLVAYNARFDFSFLVSEFRLIGYPRIKNPVIDALAMARQMIPGIGKYPQENVARVLGIPFPVKHRALEDAMVTAHIFTIFTTMLKAYDCPTTDHLARRDLLQVLTARRVQILSDALSRQSNVWMRYLSPADVEVTDRIITPKEIINGQFSNSAEFLIAYCHSSRAERNFRIDRILDMRLMERNQL